MGGIEDYIKWRGDLTFVESTGIPWEPMTDAQLAVQEAHEDLEVEKSADGVGNQTFLIQEAN